MSSWFSASGGSPPVNHCGGLPEFVSEDKIFHTLRVLLLKQPLPKGKKPDFKPFVTIHFREKGLEQNVDALAERLKTYIDSDTKAITLNTDENGLAAMLFGGKQKIRHHSCWYPWKPDEQHRRYAYRQANGEVVNPRYPVYIISKGRWKNPQTARALERMGVPYHIVVEPQEYDNYAAVIHPANFLLCPPKYRAQERLSQQETSYGNTPLMRVTKDIGF